MICPCCKGTAFELAFRKNSCDLFRCNNCGLIMVWPIPKVSEIYTEDYFQGAQGGFGYVDYDEDKRAMDNTFIAFLKRIEEQAPSKGKILDVGAATGYFLDLARKRGWEPAGVEVSAWAAAQAGKKGIEVFVGDAGSAPFEKGSFSAITLFDVFEHTTDPRGMLTAVHQLLKEKGIVAINTPDASSLTARFLGKRWHLFTPPEHLFFFGQKNLSLLLRDVGFEVLKAERIGKSFTLQYVTQFLGLPTGLLSRTGLGQLPLPINLRDNMFVLAVKKGVSRELSQLL